MSGPIVLALATATPQVSVALAGPEGPLGTVEVAEGRRHGELLAPAIETLTRLVGIGLDRVGGVAVDIGPGLFTGLRVGVATAKALADALGVPLLGRSSLDLLAAPHRHAGKVVASVVDARRSEVFWALFRPAPGGQLARVGGPTVGPPSDLAALLARVAADGRAGGGVDERAAEPAVLAVGDGALRYREELASGAVAVGDPSDAHPRAAVLAALAGPAFGAGEGGAPDAVEALYLRQADVRIGWAERPPARASAEPAPPAGSVGPGGRVATGAAGRPAAGGRGG